MLRSVYGLFYGLSCEPIAVLLFQIKNDRAVSRVLYRRALMNAPALAIYPRTAVTRSLNLPTPRGKRRGQRLPFRAPGVHGISPVRFTYARSVTAAAVGCLPRLFTLTSVTKGWKSPGGGYFLLHCLSREAFLTKLPAPSCQESTGALRCPDFPPVPEVGTGGKTPCRYMYCKCIKNTASNNPYKRPLTGQAQVLFC